MYDATRLFFHKNAPESESRFLPIYSTMQNANKTNKKINKKIINNAKKNKRSNSIKTEYMCLFTILVAGNKVQT